MTITRPAPDTENEDILDILDTAENIAFSYLAGVIVDQLKKEGRIRNPESIGFRIAGRIINEFDRNHDSGTNDISGPPACLAALANLWDQCETAEYIIDGGRLRPVEMTCEPAREPLEADSAE